MHNENIIFSIHYSPITYKRYEHIDLEVWKKSMNLVEMVYRLTDDFPDSEKFGLTNQIRRTVVSIPSNIAEGSGRKGDKELFSLFTLH